MTKAVGRVIRLRGVRHNNLKNFDLDLPIGRLIVITGLSGSGKSSLAFDTLFAEGQRRYIETFSPYARQFFDRMDKPQVDRIEGIPPAIAIEQRNSVKTTRSTVGTMTELCDYMKMLWPHLAQLYCRKCGQPVRKDTPHWIWQMVTRRQGGAAGGESRLQSPKSKASGGATESVAEEPLEVLVTFNLPLSEKLSLEESLGLISKQGYQRLLLEGQVVRLEEFSTRHTSTLRSTATEDGQHATRLTSLTVIQDRLRLTLKNRARFVEACEHAYHFGKGRLAVQWFEDSSVEGGRAGTVAQSGRDARGPAVGRVQFFSSHFHCATCDLEYREPTPALFSFNHPIGACPTCRGFGRTITIDYDRAIPDRSKTLAAGVVRPWQTGQGAECQEDLLQWCRRQRIPVNVRFDQLPPKSQDWVVNGEPGYGKDAAHEWPRAWYGVKGYFRWLESRAYKMHVRVLLSRYRSYSTCPDCHGRRFQPEALLFKVPDAAGNLCTLADFYRLPVEEALKFIEQIASSTSRRPLTGRPDPVAIVLDEVRSRLGYLVEVGLGYLTLDRPTRSLSGGETERVNLTACLGTRLVNTLFVLDEPSVGLHPRDTARLVRILESLRDTGNTVVVVEHEASVIRAADQIVDLGPGQGEAGGNVVFQGPFKALLREPRSLTGQYLSGVKRIEIPSRRLVKPSTPKLTLSGATRHNLKNLTVEIPLNRFVCLTGVSGSGKTTLAREVLLPALEDCFKARGSSPMPLPSPEPRSSRRKEAHYSSAGDQSLLTSAATIQRDNTTNVGSGKSSSVGGATTDEDQNEDESDEREGKTGTEANSALSTLHLALTGWEHLGRVVLVDQSALGKTPRSNPVVYIGAFDDVRELFAQTDLARQRGLGASAFSFNSAQGQCERCRGAGFEKVEMQFLSDVYIRCPDCNGRRYRTHILEVKLPVLPPESPLATGAKGKKAARLEWSIADMLEATVDGAIQALVTFEQTPAGRRARRSLRLLQEVGLGYLRLGQPINTLSGGESQRLKLVSHLAEFERANDAQAKPTLFLFDEPTTGLHFEDIRVLLKVFQRLVDAGHSLLVIEHNLEVIKSADWIIDLGPEAGERGGQLVVEGTPERVAAWPESHTGRALSLAL